MTNKTEQIRDEAARAAIMDLAHAVSSVIGEQAYYRIWSVLYPESLPKGAEKYRVREE